PGGHAVARRHRARPGHGRRRFRGGLRAPGRGAGRGPGRPDRDRLRGRDGHDHAGGLEALRGRRRGPPGRGRHLARPGRRHAGGTQPSSRARVARPQSQRSLPLRMAVAAGRGRSVLNARCHAMRITEIREKTFPISSPIRNAYIDFSKMTLSLVAVITDVIRDGRPVVGYGFNSNGRYGQGQLMRERFIPRVLEAAPDSLVDDAGTNLDPHRIWQAMFTNEKPGGHGERSVAIGTIDMAVWDAVAKIEGKPLLQLLADR